MSDVALRSVETPRAAWINDPRVRGLVWQVVLVGLVAWILIGAGSNAIDNLRRAGIASGFDFLWRESSFDIAHTLIDYSSRSSFGRALFVGVLNTLLVATIGIVLATILGVAIGVARISSNFILSKTAEVYVEVVRNVPLLLQLFIWYKAVLEPLPEARASINLGAGIFVNKRGLYLPEPLFGPGSWLIAAGLGAGLVGAILFRIWAKRRQDETGRRYPILLTALALIVGLPLLAALLTGMPVEFKPATQSRFNLSGGIAIQPELVALLAGLVIYTAAFIAEIVRSGIVAVSKGQTEAAGALGLRPNASLRLVVIPQAMRIIIPPLTSQFLNLTKNSSLAVAIGYSDLVHVGNTIITQGGQPLEVIAVWMAVYLGISLATAGVMNWYNQRIALVER